MWPNVKALQLIPLAAHALFARPLIIGSGSTFTIDILDESMSEGWICCDGRRQRALPQGTRVMVRESRDTLRLARLSGMPFTNRLVSKFDLPVVGCASTRATRPRASRCITGTRSRRPRMRLALPVTLVSLVPSPTSRANATARQELMLEELDIRNLGPIREAAIAPAAGMTAITGETGAGKSMLLSAIRLVSGGAAESSRVSAGADEAWPKRFSRSRMMPSHLNIPATPTMPVLAMPTAGSPVLPWPWPRPMTRASTPKTANCSFPAPYALPDVRGLCSAASPYRVRCWGPSPANWLPFMARPIS